MRERKGLSQEEKEKGREEKDFPEAELVNESSEWICHQVYSNSATSEWMP